MKLYEAKELIRDVFESSFDKEKYKLFIKNLLKDIEEKTFTYTGNTIPRAFDNYIRKLERIGKFEDDEGNIIDILVVELKRDHSIEYARSTQRNFIRWYLAGSRGGQMKDAALVAFHSETSPDWRFSFIKMQYSLETKKDELTPAKRYSFLVGEKGKSHTAQQQLVRLLKSDAMPLLSDLEEAFNIETVTNEFFEKYKLLVFTLVDEIEKIIARDAIAKNEFESKNIQVIDFAKKLMGQIVFLYFLQRKGWLGLQNGQKYGEGDRNFLRTLYNMKKVNENFFNDYLEYLFYDALSQKRVTDYYARFNCRIPFLNGGLFDPIQFYDWEKTDIVIPDELFTNTNKTKEGDIGDGILDVFDRYNFTVKEDEPLDKEVAVDPEMLGKVFERMLDVKERKSKGAFYTPREIVHYMSQESLIHYLYTVVNQASSLKTSLKGLKKTSLKSHTNLRNQSGIKIDEKNEVDEFLYFDPNGPVEKYNRNLPHWRQQGRAYFVTFRLYDSIPKEAADKIKQDRKLWFQKNKISDPSQIHRLDKEKRIEYYKLFSKRYDELLDKGYGSCVLKKQECRNIVEAALKYFDGSRYKLDEYTIQPNHVHVIVIPKDDWTLSQITHSWKSFTSNEINKILGRKGALWMEESFDHIIRSPNQFERIREYIAAQASGLRMSDEVEEGHRQDACDTILREDIETLIKRGEQFLENEEQILHQGVETRTYKHRIPESIRKHAKEIDCALENIRVCDPAVGSGAFPVGVMTEIVKARQILTPFVTQSSGLSSEQDARSTYALKSHCIHHNLYGVDIDASAVEICKLRLWLSLVVDEQRIDVIEPLPNLDYKIVKGNSLIGMPDNVMRDVNLEKEINDLMEKYYAETDKDDKRELKQIIDGKIKQLLKSAEQFTNYPIDFDFKLFFHEVFKEKGGFDVLIGNPPYFQIQKLSGKIEQTHLQQQRYSTFTKTGDIYTLFYERGVSLCKSNGNLCYISSNKWMRANYGKQLREFLIKNTNPIQVLDFNEFNIFESATVNTNILLLGKTNYTGKTHACAVLLKSLNELNFDTYVKKNIVSLSNLRSDVWIILSKESQKIKDKIEKKGIPLTEWEISIFRGIITGFNEAFIINKKKRIELINLDPNNKNIIHPVLRGKDIKRYTINFADYWLINTHNGYKNVPRIDVEKDYPTIFQYLKQFEKYLKVRQDQGAHWSNLRNCAYLNEFKKKKIVWGNLTVHSQFALADENFYVNAPSPFITPGDKYLLAVLNSTLGDWYIRQLGVTRNAGYFEYKPMFVEKLPAIKPSERIRKVIETCVDYILFLNKSDFEYQNKKLTSSYFEQLIDGLVFELYFEDEIKKAGRDILKYLTNASTSLSTSLTPITDDMTDEEKMESITQTFNELYDKNHPVRQNLYYMDTIEEIRIIKGLDK